MDVGKQASEIIQDDIIAKTICRLLVAWNDVLTDTIIYCFQRC